MLTMAPPLSAASRRRAASCAQKNTASRLVPTIRRHSSSASSTARSECATPALLTKMSTVPKAVSAASKARRIAARSSTSAPTAIALPPACSMRAFSACRRSMRRATSTTADPFSARTSAKRTPSPLDAPVTSATRPVRSNSFAAAMRNTLDSFADAEDNPSPPAPMMTHWAQFHIIETHMAGTDDDHRHEHGSELTETELRVRALETILTEKGYVDPAALDRIIEAYETRIVPPNGARAVAKAWVDAEFKRKLLADATAAVGSLGFTNRIGDHLVAVENTERLHNMIV